MVSWLSQRFNCPSGSFTWTVWYWSISFLDIAGWILSEGLNDSFADYLAFALHFYKFLFCFTIRRTAVTFKTLRFRLDQIGFWCWCTVVVGVFTQILLGQVHRFAAGLATRTEVRALENGNATLMGGVSLGCIYVKYYWLDVKHPEEPKPLTSPYSLEQVVGT